MTYGGIVQSDQVESKARLIAARIREAILSGAMRPGESIGSEAELQESYGVSRPTLRQAVRILEEEQLLEARKGPNGGFFVRTPSEAAVSHAASIYLRSRGTTEDELMIAFAAMAQQVVDRAARHPSVVERIALLDWVGTAQMQPTNWEPEVFRRYNIEFLDRVATLSGNRPLALFLTILREVIPFPTPYTYNQPVAHELISSTREYHRLMAAAIANGDSAAAVEAAWEMVVTALRLMKPDTADDTQTPVRVTPAADDASSGRSTTRVRRASRAKRSVRGSATPADKPAGD